MAKLFRQGRGIIHGNSEKTGKFVTVMGLAPTSCTLTVSNRIMKRTVSRHHKFYRQALDSVEIAKISKLMYLVDHGKMHEVKGMDLDSIDGFLRTEDLFKGIDETDYDVRVFNDVTVAGCCCCC